MYYRIKVNNVPDNAEKYIVARYNMSELWFWGSWNTLEEAERVANEISNGIVVVKEIVDSNRISLQDVKIEKIANKYGLYSQFLQTIEEMAELMQAINKFLRISKTEVVDSDSDVYKNIVEELADVQIMICQIRFLLEIDDLEFDGKIEQKLDRQMDRIMKMMK